MEDKDNIFQNLVSFILTPVGLILVCIMLIILAFK